MSCEGSSPITSRCPGSQGRQESTHPTPPCLSRACLGWASSSASILLPRELDSHPSAWKGVSAYFACTEFSEVAHSLGPSVVGCSVAIINRRLGGDHGFLERRRKAPAHQRAGAQEDRPELARAEGR